MRGKKTVTSSIESLTAKLNVFAIYLHFWLYVKNSDTVDLSKGKYLNILSNKIQIQTKKYFCNRYLVKN